MSRRPQCTTSWSSTTSTRSLRSEEPAAMRDGLRSGPVKGYCQSDAPRAGRALAELDDATELERLQRRELEPHAALARLAADAVVEHVEHERVAVLDLEADLDLGRPRVLVGVADGLGEHGLRERLELLGHTHALGPGPEREMQVAVLAPQPLDLLQQGRLRLRRLAAERALERSAQVEERGLQLGADALARGGAQLRLAGEDELDPEEALDDGLVDLAREVHALLQLARLGLLVGGQAREGGERGDLAERPQQVALGIAERRAVGAAVAEDHAEPAARGGHRRDHERALLDEALELVRDALGHRAGDLDHAVLDERVARDGDGLHRHLGVGE